MTVVRRNRPGDVGKDREHSGRAHQTNSRTHTHSMYTPLFVRSLLVRSLARAGRARARADTTDVRRRGKKKHRGSANRADTRHCALARYRLAPVLHGRTRGSLLERLVAKLRGRAPSLSRGSCPSVSRCPSARAPRIPYRSLPLSFANPRYHCLRPPLCFPFSVHLSFLPIYPPRQPFSLSRSLSLSLPLTLLLPSIENLPSILSLSLILSPSSPREEICRADSFSSRKSRHLRPR